MCVCPVHPFSGSSFAVVEFSNDSVNMASCLVGKDCHMMLNLETNATIKTRVKIVYQLTCAFISDAEDTDHELKKRFTTRASGNHLTRYTMLCT